MQIAAGLHLVDDYEEVSDLTSLRGEALDVATALFNVTAAVVEYTPQSQLATKSYQGRTALYLNDLELRRMIITSHQRVDAIIAVIRERGSSDAGAINGCLSNGTALGTGVL
jgi:hypothetical protein